jgi:uncharacterized membrane protein YccC
MGADAAQSNQNLHDLLASLKRVKHGRFRCKFHNAPITARDCAQ